MIIPLTHHINWCYIGDRNTWRGKDNINTMFRYHIIAHHRVKIKAFNHKLCFLTPFSHTAASAEKKTRGHGAYTIYLYKHGDQRAVVLFLFFENEEFADDIVEDYRNDGDQHLCYDIIHVYAFNAQVQQKVLYQKGEKSAAVE